MAQSRRSVSIQRLTYGTEVQKKTWQEFRELHTWSDWFWSKARVYSRTASAYCFAAKAAFPLRFSSSKKKCHASAFIFSFYTPSASLTCILFILTRYGCIERSIRRCFDHLHAFSLLSSNLYTTAAAAGRDQKKHDIRLGVGRYTTGQSSVSLFVCFCLLFVHSADKSVSQHEQYEANEQVNSSATIQSAASTR